MNMFYFIINERFLLVKVIFFKLIYLGNVIGGINSKKIKIEGGKVPPSISLFLLNCSNTVFFRINILIASAPI